MANYYETFKTNLFGVKNIEKFSEILIENNISYEIVQSNSISSTDTLVVSKETGRVIIPPRRLMFIGDMNADMPFIYDEVTGDTEFIDKCISEHLLPNEVCIYVYIGHEKLRYLSGGAYSIHPQGSNPDKTVKVIMENELIEQINKMDIPAYNKFVTSI